MQRRTFLGVVGSLFAAPTMFVQQMDAVPRIDPSLIQTGFPAIDKALGGGLGPGEFHSFISGDKYRRVPRSIAVHAAQHASVAYLTFNNNYFDPLDSNTPDVVFRGNLAIYHNLLNKIDWAVLEPIIADYDLIILDRVPVGEGVHPFHTVKHLWSLAHKHQTRIMFGTQLVRSVFTPDGLTPFVNSAAFMSTSIIKQTGHYYNENQLKLVKNRRGRYYGWESESNLYLQPQPGYEIFPIQNIRSKLNLTYEAV